MIYHFLSVNRGRYLCREHGSFCDSSDGYTTNCPLCSGESKCTWEVNRVDRSLQILGNVQARSQRGLAVASGLLGAASLIGLAEKITGLGMLKNSDLYAPGLLVGLSTLLVAIWLYLLSMKHMDVTVDGRFENLELSQWEKKITGFIRQVERLHTYATYFLGAAILTFSLSLIVPPVWVELVSYWHRINGTMGF